MILAVCRSCKKEISDPMEIAATELTVYSMVWDEGLSLLKLTDDAPINSGIDFHHEDEGNCGGELEFKVSVQT